MLVILIRFKDGWTYNTLIVDSSGNVLTKKRHWIGTVNI